MDGLLEACIGVKLRRLVQHVLVFRHPHDTSLVEGVPGCLAKVGVFGDLFGEDVAGSSQRSGDVGNILVGLHERGGCLFHVPAEGLAANQRSQRLEPPLFGQRCSRATLRFVRQIQVFQDSFGLDLPEVPEQLGAELALFFDLRDDRSAPLLELRKIGLALRDAADLHLIQPAGGLLAVAGNERNRGAVGGQLDHAAHCRHVQIELFGDLRDRIETSSLAWLGHRAEAFLQVPGSTV